MKHYTNKYLKYNLRLHRFQFFTVILKTFLKSQFIFNKSFIFKIKNINKWYIYFYFNFWQILKSFYFHGLMINIEYISLMKCFYRLVNTFFMLNPIYILRFFKNIQKKELRIKFIVLLKVFFFFHLKRKFFLRKKSFKISSLKKVNSKLYFFFFFVKDEKFNMFGESSVFYNKAIKQIERISDEKYKTKVGRKIHTIFVDDRLSKQLKFYMRSKFYIKNLVKRAIFLFYYINIWKVLCKTKMKIRKYTKYFQARTGFINIRYNIIALHKLIESLPRSKEKYLKTIFLKKQMLRNFVKIFIKKKRKRNVNYGNFIDYNKFKFYKKRKKFKYDKHYKGFKFKRGILHLRPSRCNYFITLTDLAYKPIQGVTTGKFAQSDNKKAKRSTTAIYFLLKYLFIFIKTHKINSLILELKNRFDPLYYQCFKFFRYKKLQIYKIYLTRQLPHHKGLRKRKLRRI